MAAIPASVLVLAFRRLLGALGWKSVPLTLEKQVDRRACLDVRGPFVATGKKKQEKNAMKKAVKALASFLRKARSHSAKKVIPLATRQMLIDQATSTLSDMKTLLKAL